MHLRLDTAAAVVVTPSSPMGATEILGRRVSLIARHGSSGDDLPWLRVVAGRDDAMCTAICNRIVALARVAGAICRDATDCLALPDLVDRVGGLLMHPGYRSGFTG
jgi:hypothetical protein